MQRRQHDRYQVWLPVRIEGPGHDGTLAINHNIGQGGMLLGVSEPIEANSKVTVTFRVPPDDREHRVPGTVTRVEKNADDPEGMWPYRIAVVFEDVVPELVPLLRRAAERLEQL